MHWFRFIIRLFFFYCIFYYTSVAITGLSAAGGRFYSPFVERWLNYPSYLRNGLLHATKGMLEMAGYNAEVAGPYKVKLVRGKGVKVVYSCLAIGILSFWIAFVLAEQEKAKRKLFYLFTGILVVFLLNALRLTLLVLAANSNRDSAFVEHHHLAFNIAVYAAVLFMMYLYVRGIPTKRTVKQVPDLK